MGKTRRLVERAQWEFSGLLGRCLLIVIVFLFELAFLKKVTVLDFKTRALDELERKRSQITTKTGLVGFDGFIDKIRIPISERFGPGEDYAPIPTIAEFAERLARAAGHSTNIELAPRLEKIGGNGPILANALVACGLKTRYIGTLGHPEIDSVFKDFAAKTDAISLAGPSVTHALEFTDGKIMLGEMDNLKEVTYENLIARTGEGLFFDILSRQDLIAMVNWTMTPHLTEVFVSILEKVLPNLPSRDQRIFFFDLTDPEKRSEGDLKSALETIRRFQEWGSVILGMNLKEARMVAGVLGVSAGETDLDGLKRLAGRIRQAMQIDMAVVHPRDSAACANRSDAWAVPGPYTDAPFITTGAGDHFNAGFLIGSLLGLSPQTCLTLGVATSGYYVRLGRSPSLNDINQFVRKWN